VRMVPGVWFVEGDEKNEGHCNNIIIEMRDYLIMVDANFPSGARLAQAAARKVSTKPVKYVFDTHHHGDHSFGNPVWTVAGATTLAYIGVVEEMVRAGPQGWRNAMTRRKDMADLKRDTPEPPMQTFRTSPYVLEDSSRRVEFHHFGWAHTRGDGLVYLPREKVLCTGDVVVNGPFNATGNANFGNWPNVISEAQKLDVTHILPGHGRPGGKALLSGQSLFLVELQKAVRAAIQQGKKLEDLVTMRDGKPASARLKLPETVKDWVGEEFFAAQVRDAYAELTQGKPRGDIAIQK
jgi:cyclase